MGTAKTMSGYNYEQENIATNTYNRMHTGGSN